MIYLKLLMNFSSMKAIFVIYSIQNLTLSWGSQVRCVFIKSGVEGKRKQESKKYEFKGRRQKAEAFFLLSCEKN